MDRAKNGLITDNIQVIQFNGTGFVYSQHSTSKGAKVTSLAFAIRGSIVLTGLLADDKGWHDKTGKVYNLHLDKKKKTLFMRKLAIKYTPRGKRKGDAHEK